MKPPTLTKKELPIKKDDGNQEIHYTRIYNSFRRWERDGCFDKIFEGSVMLLNKKGLLDTSIFGTIPNCFTVKKRPAGYLATISWLA